MGAWGYEPFQNDTALDFMSGIANGIAKKTLLTKQPLELLAGAHALSLLGSGGVIDEKTAKKIGKRLKALLKDKSFLNRWQDKKEIKQIIDNLCYRIGILW